MIIEEVKINIINDSRGEKTLEAEMILGEFSVKASVPSGKSKGTHEMVSLEPELAVEKFRAIKPYILKKDFKNQTEFDNFLISFDKTPDKSNLGGNLILALSLAFARLKAKEENKELYEYIREISSLELKKYEFPKPIFNVINGGAHAKNNLDFQEFQIIPQTGDFGLAYSLGKDFYRKLGDKVFEEFGKENVVLGDEAGYSAPFKTNEEALDSITALIREKRFPIRIGLDMAASQFYEDRFYVLDGMQFLNPELIDYYSDLINQYNIVSIEDPFNEEDFAEFANLTWEIGKDHLVITDDLTTTNPVRLKMAIEQNSGNTILIKLNQIGTLTETLTVIKMAYDNKWKAIVSHRSGETMDDFIADLAVAVNAWGIKAGAPGKPERICKYERLLNIYNTVG